MRTRGPALTEEQLKTLSDLYPTTSLREIARQIDRPYGTLEAAKRKLGLVKLVGQEISMHPCTLAPVQLAYLAGILDGEGTVTVRKLESSRNKWIPHFSISNTSWSLMEWLTGTLPGPATWIEFQKRVRPRRDIWVFHLRGMSHLPLYEAVLPYLTIKRPQMECIIRYCTLRMAQQRRDPMSEEQLSLIADIRRLNQRGSHE